MLTWETAYSPWSSLSNDKAKIMIEGGFGFPGQPLAPMPGGLCWRLAPGAFTNGLWLIPGLIGSQP